jgi:hypothetical protein
VSEPKHYVFHVVLHARPTDAPSGATIALRGLSLPTLAVRPEDSAEGFAVSFEEFETYCSTAARMFFEPDGSFVWRSGADEAPWQLDGLVADRDGRVRFIDLKGSCPPERLEWLLSPLGWPRQSILFQLAQEAVFLDEASFRRYAVAEIL